MGCINEPQRIRSDMIKQQMKHDKPHIDQNALSRQLAVYGHQTQGKLMAMKVFIHGLSGLGLQVAKNLVLAGPKEVGIYDSNLVAIHDLGTNFYASESDINKKTRAEASLPQLKQLNPNVTVHLAKSSQIEYITSNFTCVVVLDQYDRNYLVSLNKACREKNIGFIYGGNLGLYGFTFVDFGQNHKVTDATGQQQKSIHVAGISKDQTGTVYLHDEKRHGLNDGDTVVFREVKGMEQLNGKQFKITVKSPDSFTIGDTSKFSDYIGGGIANQVKVPTIIKFHSLQHSLNYPYPPGSKQMPICNWEKFGYPQQLHVILNGVLNFNQKHKRLPKNLDEKDVEQLSILCKQWLKNKKDKQGEQFTVQSIDDNLIKNVSMFACTQISPTCSFWGGIITQQIVKFTGKHSPLRQWLHHQFFEVLPDKQVTRSFAKTRYADYDILFGDQFVKNTAQSSLFMVGAGALGCEFLKMFALMGVGTQAKGRVVCTDDDNIQISNLNRQFLFRKQHVGKNKSQVACQVGKKINPHCKFQSVKLKVGQDTQDYFNDIFWTGLDFVVNAVDNIKARQYIDLQCVWYEKALFESGTLGTKCHSQIIIPHKTQSYTDIIDPPQQTIPLCTLKNFPYQIQHTIQWARDYFEGTISVPSQQLKKFYEDKQKFIKGLLNQYKQNPSTARGKLQTLQKLFEANESQSYQKCVDLSVNIFWDVFHNQIAQLLNAFPENHIIEQTKKPFWSGLKRAPKAITLDLHDPLQVQVIQAAANIFAVIFNIPMEDNRNVVISLAKNVVPHKFSPKKVTVEVDQKDKNNQKVEINEQDEIEVSRLSDLLLKANVSKDKAPTVVEFEKDDPTNWHIEFMGGVSNLRARNYKIQQVDNFKVKLIAGKIIPAIATTTAMVVGAVGIQLIKYISKKPAQTYKNVTINLALPMWVFNDPLPPIENTDKQFDPIMCGPIKAIPSKFTKWDKIDIKGPMTLQQLIKKIEHDYKITVSMITYGTSTLFSSFGQDSQKRMKLKIQEGIEQLTKKPLPKWRTIIPLGVSGTVQDGTDCIMPDIRYQM